MKRIITLLMAAVMVIGTAGLASAVEFKVSGHMHMNFSVLDNSQDSGFNKDTREDNFYAAQRFRPKLTMTAEGVTAVFEAQQHQKIWGKEWAVGGNPEADIRIRQAYIDFKLPSTPVSLKVGYQQLNLPSIWGHPVFEARVGAAVATIPFNDQVALAAFWARPADDVSNDPSHNSIDMFGALLPLNFNTVKATPYFVYTRAGEAFYNGKSNENATLLVGGVNVEIMPTEALSIKVDGIVTHVSAETDAIDDIGTGWMLAAAVDYELPWGTPGAFAWYATGFDEDGEGGLVSVRTDGFGPSSWGFAGGNTFAYDSQISGSGIGTWAIGAQIADISFVESLKHTVRVLYAQGTNDKDSGFNGATVGYLNNGEILWTEKDSFIEFNFDTTWSMYENLAAVIELGGLIPDLGSKTKDAGWEDDFAWKAQLTLRFSF